MNWLITSENPTYLYLTRKCWSRHNYWTCVEVFGLKLMSSRIFFGEVWVAKTFILSNFYGSISLLKTDNWMLPNDIWTQNCNGIRANHWQTETDTHWYHRHQTILTVRIKVNLLISSQNNVSKNVRTKIYFKMHLDHFKNLNTEQNTRLKSSYFAVFILSW